MGKMKDIATDSTRCSLCGTVFAFLLIKDQNTGLLYCTEKCKETDQMIDCELYYEDLRDEEANNNE